MTALLRSLPALALLAALFSLATGTASAQTVWINEFHYDNAGVDVGEFVEVVGLAGTNLNGWTVVGYNGSSGTRYRTENLSGTLTNQSNGFGFQVVTYPSNGLQNGAPDGIALVNAAGNVIEFLSYEGTFTAADGPAAGLTSTDIGVSENSGTSTGTSISLQGTGSRGIDFAGATGINETPGAVNVGQTLVAPQDPIVNSTADNTTVSDGLCTLREAILTANGSGNGDCATGTDITFNIPGGGVQIISVTSNLPAITAAGVTIDGYSQPGTSPNTQAQGTDAVIRVRLDNAGALGSSVGFRLNAGGTVRGLSITGFFSAINSNSSNTTVEGNFIGIDPSGAAVGGSRGMVINASGSSSATTVIGGTPAERNWISGLSSFGIAVNGGTPRIENNLITDNGFNGVTSGSSAVTTLLSNAIDDNGGVGFSYPTAPLAIALSNLRLGAAANQYAVDYAITGTATGTATSYRVQIFQNAADGDIAEGELLRADTNTLTTSGTLTFFANLGPSDGITATATPLAGAPSTTSEFSQPVVAPAGPVVNTTADNTTAGDGLCTLREAIDTANGSSNGDCFTGTDITFDIPGAGVQTITITSPLVLTATGVTIDGYSQPGASPNTALLGSNATLLVEVEVRTTEGFTFQANGQTVRGLSLYGSSSSSAPLSFVGRSGSGSGSSGNTIQGNFLGLRANGTSVAGANNAVLLLGASNTIGGPALADRNVIVGSRTNAIAVNPGGSVFSLVQNNVIGRDATLGTGVYVGSGAPNTPSISSNDFGISAGGSTIIDNVIDQSDSPGIFDASDWITIAGATEEEIDFEVDAAPNTSYLVQVFANSDDGDVDEGETLLGETTVTTDGSGLAQGVFSRAFATAPSAMAAYVNGNFATATATALSGANPGGLGATSAFSAPVLIEPDMPTARFAVVQQVVSESQPSVELTVELDRNPDADTDFSVVLTEGDPADIGGFTSETVTAGASGASAFTVTVPITDDALSEADERFVFAISADASELRLGSPSQTVVLIVDNDGEARTVSVPLRDRDADGEEDAGPRFFALPINTSASTIADAAGADSVYVVAADGALAALDPSDLVPAGRPVLVDVEEGADLTIAGTVPAGLVTYPAGRIGADPEARLLVGVGNAIDDPVDLEAIDIAGGTLADVALVFDDARGAFRPVSLPRLSDPKTLAPFDAVVVQVVPDNAAADVSVTVVPAPLVSAPGTEVDEAPFGPAADESGAVLTLQPVGADGPGDVAALRFDVGGIPGLDGLDAYDLVSPLGGTLAATATSDATTLAQAPLAAYAESQLAAGQAVTVPLVVIVPEMGTYEIAAPEIFQGSISDRPVVVEILDNSIATTLTDGDTATFVAGSGDAGDPGAFAGRFAVRVSLGAAVSEEGGPDVAGLRVFPNPSAGVAAVQVTPAEAGPARVAVYDALGRQVAVLHDGPLPAGTTRLSSGALSPGLYVVRVDGPGLAETRQLTVVR